MANIDELIKQKCAEYDITPDVLTPEELEQLKREIEEFADKNLPTIYALIDKYKDGKTVVIFKSREQADAFLNGENL